MKNGRPSRLCGAFVAISLAALSAAAAAPAAPAYDGVKDANAALDALAKGDYPTAIKLFTQVINLGKLVPQDKELAYLKRAQAYIGISDNASALMDLDNAVAIDPSDKEIQILRDKAIGKPPEPTLADELGIIQAALTAQGRIDYSAALHDTTKNTDWSEARSLEIAAVAPDAAACRVAYHFKAIRKDEVLVDKPAEIGLKDISSIEIISKAAALDRANADNGHPEWHAQITPAVSVMMIAVAGGADEIDFKDADSAAKVAAALIHASKLCGGSATLAGAGAAAGNSAPTAPVASAPVAPGPDSRPQAAPPAAPPAILVSAPPPASGQQAPAQPATALEARPIPPASPATVPAPQPASLQVSAPAPIPAAQALPPPPAPPRIQVAAPPPPPVAPQPASPNQAADANSDILNNQIRANNQALDAKFQADQAAYKAAMDAYENERKRTEDVKAANEAAYAAQMREWQARVDACKSGDVSKCGN